MSLIKLNNTSRTSLNNCGNYICQVFIIWWLSVTSIIYICLIGSLKNLTNNCYPEFSNILDHDNSRYTTNVPLNFNVLSCRCAALPMRSCKPCILMLPIASSRWMTSTTLGVRVATLRWQYTAMSPAVRRRYRWFQGTMLASQETTGMDILKAITAGREKLGCTLPIK